MIEIRFDMSKVDGVGSDRNRRDMDILTKICARSDTPKEAGEIIAGSIGEVIGKFIAEQLWAFIQPKPWVNPYENAAWGIAEANLKRHGYVIAHIGGDDYRVVIADADSTAETACHETLNDSEADHAEPSKDKQSPDARFSDAQIAQLREIVDEAVRKSDAHRMQIKP